mgnify:CR=1 FL=1
MTGAKQSDVDQECGSRLPRATMRHFARFGSPFSSYLMVEIAMVGRAEPTMWRILLYSSSLMVVQAGRSLRPKYSSS